MLIYLRSDQSPDLTERSFLQAFRRFAGRKSLPSRMVSDNASTFTASPDELKELFQSPSLKDAFTNRGVVWQFIPKRAPWFGGFWERLIGLTKNSLKNILGRSFITLPELQTIVVEIEAILNDRPLTYLSSEVQDDTPLTPSHLLYGRRITSLPYSDNAGELEDPNFGGGSNLRKRNNLQAEILRRFWSRWQHEYLTSLREFHRSSGNNEQTIKEGELVMVHDDKPRNTWKLAIIEELIRGNDGLVRAANIRTKNGRTSRPITKLYPLEVFAENKGERKQLDNIEESDMRRIVERNSLRPKRTRL